MPRSPFAANLVAALVLSFGALAAASARAQGDDAGVHVRASTKRAVVVTFVGAGDAQPALEASLTELFARHHLVMNPSGDVPPEAVLARVQIDLTSPAQAVLLITDGRTGEVRAFRAIPRDPSAAITREEIAHTVQSAVESELLVDPAPAPAPTAPPPPPEPVAVVTPSPMPAAREQPASLPKTPSWFALDVATLAGAGGFASGAGPDVRLGGGVIAGSRLGLRPSITLTALYTLPFQSQGLVVDPQTNVSSQTSLVSVRAVPSIEVVRTRWLAIDVGAGGGLDVLSVSAKSNGLPSGYLISQSPRVDPIVTGGVTGQVALVTGVVFVVNLSADVDLATRHYVFADGGTDESVISPWRVRPMALAGLAFTALGDGLFSKGSP